MPEEDMELISDEGGGGVGTQTNILVVDGLLSCIAKALSRSASNSELVSVIVRDSNELEVKAAWVKLFDHFDEAFDVTQKKKIKDITRQTTKNRVDDIVNQLCKVETQSDLDFIVMPWSYTIKEFVTDSENLTQIMVEEKSKDYDARFEAFERKMDKKHGELCDTLRTLLQGTVIDQNKLVETPSVGGNVTFAGMVRQPGVGGQVGGHTAGAAGQLGRGLQPGQTRGRSTSPSVKRVRTEEDGSYAAAANQRVNLAQGKPKPVVGTSDSNLTGRKMRSPPADIFVWGVHPLTSIEDIVNDLAASGIDIKDSDVEKKSKPEAYLCSYKISVPIPDLTKALDPSIWPLRVKVREFVHYARKNPRQNSGQTKPGAGGGQRQQGALGGQRQPSAGTGGGHQALGGQTQGVVGSGPLVSVPGITLDNMFAALARLEAKHL